MWSCSVNWCLAERRPMGLMIQKELAVIPGSALSQKQTFLFAAVSFYRSRALPVAQPTTSRYSEVFL